MSILGIDLGTGACKGVAFDYAGNVLAKSEKDYQTFSTKPGWCELDAECFLNAIRDISREISAKLTHDPIIAMAISSHGETIIPVGRDRKALVPAFMNADNRAFVEIEELTAKIPAKRLYQITGTPPHPMYALSNIMWFKKHNPQGYAATYKFCSCEDYIMLSLGLDPVCNYSNCCRTLMFDIHKRDWSDEILYAAGVEREKLSTPIPSGQVVGKLDREHAAFLGLAEGVTVVSGGFDHFNGLIGSGVIKPGLVSCSAGSYEGLTTLTTEVNSSDEAYDCCLNTFCHLDGLYANFAYFPAGLCTKWFVNELCGEDRMAAEKEGVSVYEVLAREVQKLPQGPTDIFVTPHMVGSCCPYNDPRARGSIYGLSPAVSRHALYKAVYEGIAHEFAMMCDLMARMTSDFEKVRINGGGARSDFTLHLRANTSGRIIEQMDTNEAPVLGVAILAGVAVGIFKDVQDGIDKAARCRQTVEPDPQLKKQYQENQKIYEEIYHSLAPVRDMWRI